MKYNIFIKDNETGEIIVNTEANAIVAGISNEERFHSLCATSCNGRDLIGTLDAAKNAIKTALEGVPHDIVKVFLKMCAHDLAEGISDGEGDNG